MIRLPFVSRARFDFVVAQLEDATRRINETHERTYQVVTAERHERANLFDRYERLVLRITYTPAPETFTAAPVAPLPASIHAALDAMGLTGVVRAQNEALAHRLLAEGVDAREVVQRLTSGVLADGTAAEYLPETDFPEDDEDV